MMEPKSRKADLVLIPQESTTLLKFLRSAMSDRSATTVKSYLTHRQIAVNDRITTQFDLPVSPSDRITLTREKGRPEFRNPYLRIVYEDDALIVIDKRNGLLSMATDRVSEKTAYRILSDYVKTDDPDQKIFIVHRLDRETSGLMMFARSIEIQHQLQEHWTECITDRRYVAVVEGVMDKDEGQIETYLTESSALKVYVSNEGEGRPAVTHYRTLKRSARNSLVELHLETGRKNQIRVHLQYIGHPIVGDKKYGARDLSLGRVALHASRLNFIHPVTGREMKFSTEIPALFQSCFKK